MAEIIVGVLVVLACFLVPVPVAWLIVKIERWLVGERRSWH